MSNAPSTPTTIDAEALAAPEAAKLCGVSRSTWLKLQASGRVPRPVRLGRCVRWLRSELLAWLAAGCPSRERWDAIKPGGQRR